MLFVNETSIKKSFFFSLMFFIKMMASDIYHFVNKMFSLFLDSCSNVKCSYGSKCVQRIDRTTECICPSCPAIYVPICGDNGITYASECYLRQTACNGKFELKVIKDEACGK